MQRGQTTALVEDKKKKCNDSFASTTLVSSGVMNLCVALLMFFASTKVSPDCDKPFKTWFIVEGVFGVVQSLSLVIAVVQFSRLSNNEYFWKAQVYHEQGRRLEQAETLQKAEREGQGVRMGPVMLNGCSLCCLILFDMAWYIYGLVMALQPGCPVATIFFWKIFVVSVCASLISHGVQHSCAKSTSAREPIVLDQYVQIQQP
eukprot:TRINITY_DN58895_c0_g1_i1.p1 TRINITY_DN58895_c0_g1~~TRINITY_DN58895_c0_g1_i1.p1  ORF type:complete len:203 (+),score=33.35 TRINITY_DN58895_c0_g1_i1:71-679(+)